MAEEMRNRVSRAWDAINQKDWDAALDAIEPVDSEVEWIPPPEMPEQSVYRGPDALKERWAYLGANIADALGETEEIIEAGERTFVGIRVSGRGEGSGAPYEARLYQVITTSDDLVSIIRIENFYDRHQALEAAELSE